MESKQVIRYRGIRLSSGSELAKAFEIIAKLSLLEAQLLVRQHEYEFHNQPKPVDTYASIEKFKKEVSEWSSPT